MASGLRGEKVPHAALTDAQAEAARLRFDAKAATIGRLAGEYGCCYKTMWRVVNRITYRGGLTNGCPTRAG